MGVKESFPAEIIREMWWRSPQYFHAIKARIYSIPG
jgi:hypothetical protein